MSAFGRGRREPEQPDKGSVIATEDADRLGVEVPGLIEQANGVGWYERHGNAADVATVALCRLRRAAAGAGGGPLAGDEAVRRALAQASPEALAWLASRTVSHLDESGFPETVELYAGPLLND